MDKWILLVGSSKCVNKNWFECLKTVYEHESNIGLMSLMTTIHNEVQKNTWPDLKRLSLTKAMQWNAWQIRRGSGLTKTNIINPKLLKYYKHSFVLLKRFHLQNSNIDRVWFYWKIKKYKNEK